MPMERTPDRLDLSPHSEFLLGLQAKAQAAGRECVMGALILNPGGRVFVQKRSPARRLFPGCWDLVGGHVEPGETLYQALAREIQEETVWTLSRIRDVVAVFESSRNGNSTFWSTWGATSSARDCRRTRSQSVAGLG